MSLLERLTDLRNRQRQQEYQEEEYPEEDYSQPEQLVPSTSLIAGRMVETLPEFLSTTASNPTLKMMSGMIQAMAQQHLHRLSDEDLTSVLIKVQNQISYWITGERTDYPKEDTSKPYTAEIAERTESIDGPDISTDESGCEVESL